MKLAQPRAQWRDFVLSGLNTRVLPSESANVVCAFSRRCEPQVLLASVRLDTVLRPLQKRN
jgi:hypothetical protein